MHMSGLKAKVFSHSIHLNQFLASQGLLTGTSDFVRITSIFGNIFYDFLCLINYHEFANSITCISNIRQVKFLCPCITMEQIIVFWSMLLLGI